jgi:hypothetical protein
MPLETREGAQFAQGVSQETDQMPISGVSGFAGRAGKLSMCSFGGRAVVRPL